MWIAEFRIWTRFAVSISNDNNYYITSRPQYSVITQYG